MSYAIACVTIEQVWGKGNAVLLCHVVGDNHRSGHVIFDIICALNPNGFSLHWISWP